VSDPVAEVLHFISTPAKFMGVFAYECLIDDGRDSKEGEGEQKILNADDSYFIGNNLSEIVRSDEENPRREHEPDDTHDELFASGLV